VIPLGLIFKGSDGKKEINYPVKWKKYQENIATEEEINSWRNDLDGSWKNLGIVTGRISNLLVLDTDLYKKTFNKELLDSFKLPITPVQQTASGGRQYFFRLPEGVVIKNDVCIGNKESGIDIRGDGGMVVVPPSKTPYGQYEWLLDPLDTPLADIPPKLLDLIIEENKEDQEARKTLPELVGLNEGEGRNNAIASLVGKLVNITRIENWDTEILPVINDINNTYNPPLSDSELMSVYNSITKIENSKRFNTKDPKVENTKYTPALTHSELIAKEFPPARYTLEPFFEQGTMNMVSAPPNTWKSWLLFLFAGHIVAGTAVFDKFQTEKARVMIVNEEDSPRLIQDRLRLLNITDTSLPIYYRIAHGSKLKIDFVDSLIKEAKDKDIGVIMFDSLRAIHESDENDSTAMQGVMDLLKKIARENITVIFTHHHRKKSMFSKNDDTESSRGSSAINAAISGHMSLEESNKDDQKSLIVKHLKSKVGEKLQPFDLEIDVGEIISFKYMGDHKPAEKALNEAKNRIINELEDRKELLGRKDFIFLNIGKPTSIKEATNFLEKEGKVKVVTRKQAENAGMKIFNNTGKPNEKLYFIEDNTNLDVFDDT
jgi:hypothetical protein